MEIEIKNDDSNIGRILRMLQYLIRSTDEQNMASTVDLLEVLQKDGRKTDRKIVDRYVTLLIDSGFDVIKTKGKRNANLYYYGDRELNISEINLLIDAVASSRFINTKVSEMLIEKLTAMAGPSEADYLRSRVHAAGRIKTNSAESTYNTEIILEAILLKRKISYQQIDYTINKEKTHKHDGYVYVTSPYDLLWNDDRYYLLGYSDKYQKVITPRVDRIENLQILDEPCEPKPEGYNVEFYANQVIKMMDGETRKVRLICEKERMINIIDKFGIDVETRAISDDHFEADVEVSVSKTFYGWVCQFGGSIKITGPEDIVEDYRKTVLKTLAD